MSDRTRPTTNLPLAGWHRWFIPIVSLLYSVFWFYKPWHSHSAKVWILFAVFYCLFLLAYWRLVTSDFREGEGGWLATLFVLGFLYYPFNHQAVGECVYPVVLCAYALRQSSAGAALWRYLLIMAGQSALVFAETWALHLSMEIPESVSFSMIVIGLCNFAYARQELMADQLRHANEEIEHLAQTAERERIARDLHDLLGHTLTTIVLKSDVANRLFHLQPEMAQREIAEVEATARKALAEVREAVSGYRAEGFAAEVSRARRTLASGGVQLSTSLEPMTLDAAQVNALCMVLREAVTNVVRHARATTCHLELLRDGAALRMTLSDNGNGELGVEGNGTFGMRERLRALGGSLLRGREEGSGMRLIAELPLADRAPEVSAAEMVPSRPATPLAGMRKSVSA